MSMRPSRPPRRGLRAALASTVTVTALVGATIAPVAAAEPGPTSVPAITGFVTNACTGLPILRGVTVGISSLVIDPTTGMGEPGPIQSPSSGPFFGAFSYGSVDPGPVQLTVSAPGYVPLGAVPDPATGASPGVTLTRDPGPINLPAGQSFASGLVLDIRLAPLSPSTACKPPSPNLPAISGRAVDAATGRGLAGLTVGVAPLVLDPTTGLVDPGPVSLLSFGPFRGLFVFRDPGPVQNGFQLHTAAPGQTSLGADPAIPPVRSAARRA
jgi:hypothetical protein